MMQPSKDAQKGIKQEFAIADQNAIGLFFSDGWWIQFAQKRFLFQSKSFQKMGPVSDV